MESGFQNSFVSVMELKYFLPGCFLGLVTLKGIFFCFSKAILQSENDANVKEKMNAYLLANAWITFSVQIDLSTNGCKPQVQKEISLGKNI